MYSKELEELIDATLADGTLSETERRVLHKRAMAEGADVEELDVVIDGRLAKMQRQQAALRVTPAMATPADDTKYGTVMKCPNCGAQVVGGTAVCHECGFTFTNVNASTSVQKLQEKIEEFNRRQEGKSAFVNAFTGGDLKVSQAKLDLISTFPVPNARGDLLDMLTTLDALANILGPKNGRNATGEDLSYGYWLLFANCANKARISFSNDTDFARFFAKYDSEIARTKGIAAWWKNRNTQTKAFTGFVIFCIVLGLLIYFISKSL